MNYHEIPVIHWVIKPGVKNKKYYNSAEKKNIQFRQKTQNYPLKKTKKKNSIRNKNN